jgi:hypothetical protein
VVQALVAVDGVRHVQRVALGSGGLGTLNTTTSPP